jgi:N6-adenosine-specific RNA methylase IME4
MTELGKFDVIYADPPWSYSEVPYFKKSLAIQYKYPVLKHKDLLNLDVESIAKKNSWMFMWAVWAQLPHALEVMNAWGFSYRTCAFVWAKKTKNNKNAKTYGRCCTQGSTEVVLCGKRGSPKRYAQNVEQFMEALRRGNSQKPDEIYDRLDQIVDPTVQVANQKRCDSKVDEGKQGLEECPNYNDGCWCKTTGAPDVRKIELFARQQWGNWYALGNDEALDDDSNDKCIFGDIRDTIGVKDAENISSTS